MSKEIEIHGCVTVQPELTENEFWELFIDFIEANKWSFGGGMRTIVDGFYLNPDGTKGNHVSQDNNLETGGK